MSFIYFILAFMAFFIVLLTFIARWEKRMVWPYGELKPTPSFEDSSVYGKWRVNEAFHAGFILLGWAPQMTGPNYRVNYAFLVPPDRQCLVIVGVGTIFGMRLEATWLHSPTSGNQSFYTIDHQNGVEIDVSRTRLSQLVPGKPFLELWNKHREWLQRHQVTPWRFREGFEVEEFRRFRTEHYRSLAEKGFIYYTEPAQTHWRYTMRGAVKLAVMNYTIGLIRALSFGKFPRGA